MDDLVVTGGRTTADFESGGGIRAGTDASLTLVNSTVSGNGTAGHRAYGGGISGAGTVTLTDSTVTVTVTGADDPIVIDPTVATGTVAEDSGLGTIASGDLDATDADAGQTPSFTATSIDTAFGLFEIDINGSWIYRLDNDTAAVQALNAGDTLSRIVGGAGLDLGDVHLNAIA